MNVPSFESNHEVIASLESEELLKLARDGIIQLAYSRLDDAVEREANEEIVYYSHVATNTPDEEALAILLTRDGIRPFQEEVNDKEQIIIYYPQSTVETIWLEHVREGDRDRYLLDRNGLSYQEESILADEPEVEVEPTEEDIVELEIPKNPMSEMARLSVLREKIDRFLLTPFS